MRTNSIALFRGTLVWVGAIALIVGQATDARATSSNAECGATVTSTSLDPQSTTTTFPAGSLIIPMDSCYNPDLAGNPDPMNSNGTCSAASPTHTCYASTSVAGDVRLPFGLIYLLAENNIPVSVILNNNKLGLTDEDFHVMPTTTTTSSYAVSPLVAGTTGYSVDNTKLNTAKITSTSTVYYSGMPFVIDASFAQQAMQVITNYDNTSPTYSFTGVNMHVANYPFTAPVLAVIASRPKPVLIDGSTMTSFFDESGITGVAATGTAYLSLTMGSKDTSWSYTYPSLLGSAPAGCSGYTCSSPLDSSNNRIVDVIWAENTTGNVNNWTPIGSFFTNLGTVLGLDDGYNWESGTGGTLGGTLTKNGTGADKNNFCATVAVKQASGLLSQPGPTTQYPASNRFLQVDDMQFQILGGGGGSDSGADNTSGWYFASTPASYTVALSDGSNYSAIAGHPKVSGTQTSGNLVYLSSLHSWSGHSSIKDGGLHVMYNTLVASGGGTQCTASELTRSSSVANTTSAYSTGYAEYLGSFDWNVPSSGSAMGNVLYQANPADYPYTTGHFREYKPTGTYTATTTTTNTPTCSTTDNTSPCNWDAATMMKTFANRNVYVATGTFGNYTMQKVSSLTSSDTALKYISTHLDSTTSLGILGGIDWSTAAVIESHPVGTFTTRPTIAYVGARDGMLHAFCVKPATGSTDCYGFSPGQEIWALIPPGMRTKITTAYNNGSNMDWSTVNVGGAIRVADMTDKFGGSSTAVTRTVLIVGMHDSGYIDALDISDPNPANLNSDGFKFLWENDGTHVDTTVSGLTAYTMGATNGATIAQVSQKNGSGVALVTSATCYGQTASTTCASTTKQGYNVYAIRLGDGVIVSSEQVAYTNKSSLLSTAIPNDVPPLPTVLDTNDDGLDESVFVATLEGKVRKYTLSSANVTAPTLAAWSTNGSNAPFDVYDANNSSCSAKTCNPKGNCGSGITCQPIGVSPSVVRTTTNGFDVLVATGGADWARRTTDKSDLTATTNLSYVTGFDATTYSQFPTSPFSLGGIQPPTSAAGGTSHGTSAATPVSLRAYAQLTVAGSDLYANVTSLSIGIVSQLVEPLVTSGTYGNILKWSNINSTSPTSYGSILSAGTAYAGGAGSVLETQTGTGTDAELFIAGATSSVRQTLSSSSTSLQNTTYAINASSSVNRPFATQAWFDLSN